MIRQYFFILLFFGSALLGEAFGGSDLVYLTWEHEPQTSIVVQWITDVEEADLSLEYRARRGVVYRTMWAESQLLPDGEHLLHRAELKGLRPNSSYSFRLTPDGQEYHFRTLPDSLDQPIQFVSGGDMYSGTTGDAMRRTCRAAAATDPYFGVAGGDIAYSEDKSGLTGEIAERWYVFLTIWMEEMVTPDGYLIPIVPVIGNHDVVGRYDATPDAAPFFYQLFPWPGRDGRNTLDIGEDFTLIGLDTGHSHQITGEQTEWLEATLKEKQHVRHKFAVYHVGAFPSRRRLDYRQTTEVRENWVPLFDRYNLEVALEHHDHAYKRTLPLKHEKPNESGTVYIGDGCWGVVPRQPKTPEQRPFLAHSEATQHFIFVKLEKDRVEIQAVDQQGHAFDSTSISSEVIEPATP